MDLPYRPRNQLPRSLPNKLYILAICVQHCGAANDDMTRTMASFHCCIPFIRRLRKEILDSTTTQGNT